MRLLLFISLFVITGVSHCQTDFEKGETFYKKEQFNKAKSLFENYLLENPKHKRTREYLGDIAGYNKDWDVAIDYFEDLVDEDPKNANYHFKYGGVLGMKALSISKIRAALYIGDLKQAFETAADLDPKHIEARWALVELYMQLPAIIGGSEQTSTKYANQLLQISPVDGYLANGYIAEYADRPVDAERLYKKAIENSSALLKGSNRNASYYQIGKIVAQYNLDSSLGISCLKKYIDNHSTRDGVPKDWAYLRLAQIYRNLNNKTEALTWIEKALASRSDFKEALSEKDDILAL